jgi:glucosamine kinase
MILIADSGSTKTDWRLIDGDKKIHQFRTLGFNPYFQGSQDISKEISENLLPEIRSISGLFHKIKDINIHFYGAGCSSESKCSIVKEAIRENFRDAEINIHHDLLAASRALCGKNEGIVAILGTGSNSCYYDGNDVAENVYSIGFILGDEGSGANIGKTFITAYLYNEVPAVIAKKFDFKFKLGKEEILENIYKSSMPSRYLAGFSKFVFQNIKEPYMVDLVAGCFRQFFEKHICKYPKHTEIPMSCVGSVGFYYSNILKSVAAEKGVMIGKILETPIAGLALYHLGE